MILCMHVHENAHRSSHVHICTLTCTHKHTCTHTHIHMHTHRYTTPSHAYIHTLHTAYPTQSVLTCSCMRASHAHTSQHTYKPSNMHAYTHVHGPLRFCSHFLSASSPSGGLKLVTLRSPRTGLSRQVLQMVNKLGTAGGGPGSGKPSGLGSQWDPSALALWPPSPQITNEFPQIPWQLLDFPQLRPKASFPLWGNPRAAA